MKRIYVISLFTFLFIVSSAATFSILTNYEVTSGHSIAFTSADPSGTFTKINGNVSFSDTSFSDCKFDLKIPVSSISTGNALKNKKAQTAEWFDATKYPNITFVSNSISKSNDTLKVTGNLTIKGKTKEITIPLTYKEDQSKFTFKGSFKVNRIHYGVGKKSEVVPDVMSIKVSVPFIKK